MNSNELVLNGNDPYFTPVRNVLNSISFLFHRWLTRRPQQPADPHPLRSRRLRAGAPGNGRGAHPHLRSHRRQAPGRLEGRLEPPEAPADPGGLQLLPESLPTEGFVRVLAGDGVFRRPEPAEVDHQLQGRVLRGVPEEVGAESAALEED